MKMPKCAILGGDFKFRYSESCPQSAYQEHTAFRPTCKQNSVSLYVFLTLINCKFFRMFAHYGKSSRGVSPSGRPEHREGTENMIHGSLRDMMGETLFIKME